MQSKCLSFQKQVAKLRSARSNNDEDEDNVGYVMEDADSAGLAMKDHDDYTVLQ